MQNVRRAQLEALTGGVLDTLIIGGGINGAGTLRDLALRAQAAGVPLRLGLIEQKHFASGTSGRNSQLIHGGLRYLKYFEFSLVRESLRERSTLLHIAPHLVHPLPFLMPMYGWKSRILYGTGLTIYDLLSGAHGIRKHRILNRSEVADLEPA
ncbi:MAG: FAD-dependent oxidoreductase, partial [Acidobacteriota bacterium]|nr:FAD-dependent oxidoreductase [Acidobacteriota bacterium]